MMFVLLFGRAKECQDYYTLYFYFFYFLHCTEIIIRYKLWLKENGWLDARMEPTLESPEQSLSLCLVERCEPERTESEGSSRSISHSVKQIKHQ